MRAFGCSAVSLGGNLLVSTYGGGIFLLIDDEKGEDSKAWMKVHQLETGRFFHQMLPVDELKFALVGGSHMEHDSHLEIEVFEIVNRVNARIVNQ